MAENVYDVGDTIYPQASFYNLSNALADPDTVTGKYEDPDGNETSVAAGDITNVSTGVYRFTAGIAIDQPGRWWYRFEGVGTIDAAVEQSFVVRRSVF